MINLATIRIASPCSADWNAMSGDERTRFCDECGKHVYNISSMTRREASALVAKTEGRLCVRFYRRADGTVLTQDCPVSLRARAARVRKRMSWAVSGLLGLAAMASAQSPFTGTVRSRGGELVPGAFITLSDQGTGMSATTTANENGQFRFTDLMPGGYSLSIDFPGYQKQVWRDIEIGRHLDLVLELLPATEVVVVGEVAVKRNWFRRIFR